MFRESSADRGMRPALRSSRATRTASPGQEAPQSNEFEQTLLRFFFALAIAAYMLVLAPAVSGEALDFGWPHAAITAEIVFASFYLLHYFWDKRTRPFRIILGIIVDLSVFSVFVHVGGKAGAPLVPIYLWISLGNGFRFGNAYLLFGAAWATGCFLTVLLITPYWQDNTAIGISFMASLVVLPGYASILIRKLRIAKIEAEQANASKSAFLATMSHELRTPLNAVIGMADILRSQDIDGEQQRMLGRIRTSGETLLELVNDLLDYARLEAGRQPVNLSDVNVYALASRIDAIVGPTARSKGIDFNIFIDPETPEWIRSDKRHLQKILLNLTSNAVKYTDDGGVRVTVSSEAIDARSGGLKLRFWVEDTGAGIPPEEQEAVFDRFTQTDQTIKSAIGGTGLGLAICRELSHLLGGEISLESALGVGSTFSFYVRTHAAAVESALAVDACPPCFLLAQSEFVNPSADADSRFASSFTSVSELQLTLRARGLSRPIVFVDLALLTEDEDGDQVLRELRASRAEPVLIALSPNPETYAQDLRIKRFCLTQVTDLDQDKAITNAMSRAQTFMADQESACTDNEATLTPEQGLRVLVAEDNPVNREVAKKMLEQLGHEVHLANNGDHALDAMEEGAFDIVFMDINMPVVDGVEATRLLRLMSDPAGSTPVVGLTADATDTGRIACLEAGMIDVIYKPVSKALFTRTIAKYAAQSAGAPLPLETEATSREDQDALEDGVGDNVISLESQRPEGATQNALPVDPRRIEELRAIDDDDSFIRGISDAFLSDATELLEETRLAIETGDLTRLQNARHALRSSALNIGAVEIGDLCHEARTMSADALNDAGPEFLSRLKKSLKETREFLIKQA